MKVILSKRFRACLRSLTDPELQQVGAALNTAGATFGHPHLHQGRGIRQLGRTIYEVRAGLARRLVFSREEDSLLFDFAGSHDEIRAYLKNRRRDR